MQQWIATALAAALFAGPLTVSADEFSDFQKQMGQEAAQFQQFKNNLDAEYKRYETELKQAFDTFRTASASVWGKDKVVVPSNSQMVNYSDDMRQRSIVDFERGKVKVEVAIDPSKGETLDDAKKRLRNLVKQTLITPADTRPITEIVKKPKPEKVDRKKPAALAGQIKTDSGRWVTQSNAEGFSKKIMGNTKVSKIKGEDKTSRTVISVEIPLVPDHIKKRATQYKADVKKYASKYEMPTELVYAVMETESFFNPTAKSSVPAFGLMQLVPLSGARDAYQYVFKKDKIVSESYLYKPQRNIELGAAYLKKVYSDYLPKIRDPESRLWCTVAAYNTGAGNVFRTFAGKYNKARHGSRRAWRAQATKKINSMNPEQVFQYMKKNLPYKETQNYIVKVKKRMPKYRNF